MAAAEAVPNIKLNTGAAMPAVGLGTWQADPGVVGNAVKQAIKRGYRHIDCAKAYMNETEIGDALQDLYKGGVVRREDLFITSKLWCTDHNPDDVAEALNGSLQRLQCDYLDLYLMHWPVALKKDTQSNPPLPEDFAPLNIQATWRALEKCYASGKAKAIGISNFSVEKTKALLSCCEVRPAVNQVECHPLWQQKKLAPFLKYENTPSKASKYIREPSYVVVVIFFFFGTGVSSNHHTEVKPLASPGEATCTFWRTAHSHMERQQGLM